MAIDTAEKRLSAINISCPWRGIGALPDGVTVNAQDRIGLDYLYSGFASSGAFTLNALSGSFSWTGSDVTFSPTTHIDSAQKRFAAMNVGNVWRGINLFPTGGITKSGRAVLDNFYTVPVTVNAYTITCQSGAFIWDGEPSFSDFEITNAASGVYSYTGNSANLIATRKITLTSGVFAYTGSDSNLQKLTQKTLFPATGFFALSGSDALLDRPRGLTADSGSFSSEGFTIRLIFTDANGFTYEGGPRRKLDGGGRRRRRHKYEIEIDGEVFDAKSEDEAIYILEKVKDEARAVAQLAVDRAFKATKRPIRKILNDARRALKAPEIDAAEPISEPAKVVKDEIDELYKEALQTIEIGARLNKQEQDQEDEEILLLLL